MRRNTYLQLTALFCVAFNLRLAMACIGPVLDRLRFDLDMSRAQLGLLSTLPVLCMSLFAPVAQRISAMRGHEHAILFATLAIALATATRIFADEWLMLSSAFVAGVGIAIAGTLLNTFVKEHFAQRAVMVSGMYSAALCLGAALSAGLTEPMVGILDDSWRAALAAWSIPGFVATGLWWFMLHRMSPNEPASAAVRKRIALPWRNGHAWLTLVFFGLQSIVFYVPLSWLAPMYVELGWTAAKSGAALGVWIALQFFFILLVAHAASRTPDRRPWLIACGGAAIIAFVGFAAAPLWAPWLWIALSAFACGGWFPLCMNFPLDYGRTPSEAGSWTAMMLCGGYLISAGSPALTGWMRDADDGYAAIFALLAALSAALLALAFFLRPQPQT